MNDMRKLMEAVMQLDENDNFADTVLSRLESISSNELTSSDTEHLRREATRLQTQGRTTNEVVSLLRHTEEINPDVDEDLALRRMKAATNRVGTRLQGEK